MDSANFKVSKEVIANSEGQEVSPKVASTRREYRHLARAVKLGIYWLQLQLPLEIYVALCSFACLYSTEGYKKLTQGILV